jgi:hypothetical protein
MNNFTHFLYCPFTGLGLYNGFRGNHWLKNRIQVFKQFVVPSLLAQTNKDFILWVSWRPQERTNSQVKELKEYLNATGLANVFTYGGVCFWDDKYKDVEARERLIMALHHSINDLILDLRGDWILMTIQPSDDIYRKTMVDEIQKTFFAYQDAQVVGYSKGYIINYQTKEVAEYNPLTNPPFFTIKFPKPVFIDPLKHLEYTGPYKSHEYVSNYLKYYVSDERGFMVGIHGENISTVFDHPFKGVAVDASILSNFGIAGVEPLKIKIALRKRLFRKLPHSWQRKLRYIFGEKMYAKIYSAT